MKELGHSIPLTREPTLAESAAIRDVIAKALAGLGAEVTQLPGPGLEFHMPAPWKTGKPNPLFAVTGGELAVVAGTGARRRVRYSLSFVRLRAYAAVAVVIGAAVGWFEWARPTMLLVMVLAWLVVFVVPWLIAARRFRRVVAAAAASVMG